MDSGERTERTAKTIAKVGEILYEFPKPDIAQGCLVPILSEIALSLAAISDRLNETSRTEGISMDAVKVVRKGEPMADLIDRQVAIDALETVGYDFTESDLSETELIEVCEAVGDVEQDMISRIKKLPSAQPRPRGRWVPNYIYHYEDRFGCTACGRSYKVDTCMGKPIWDFCPNCGADMRGTR